ncbi:hypothetical protein J0J30_23655, partial [Vibrio vulnificus]|nr:hypothetical protein [Vibrio vulnificus]
MQEDQQLKEALFTFYDPPMEPLDEKLFSPLPSQVQAKIGGNSFYHSGNSNNNNMHQFNDDVNEADVDITEFFD